MTDDLPPLGMVLIDDNDLPALLAGLGKHVAPLLAVAAGAVPASAPTAGNDAALLDARDVADQLGIPLASVYELVRRKKIGCVRVSVGSRRGKQRRFKISPAQLRTFIASNSVASET